MRPKRKRVARRVDIVLTAMVSWLVKNMSDDSEYSENMPGDIYFFLPATTSQPRGGLNADLSDEFRQCFGKVRGSKISMGAASPGGRGHPCVFPCRRKICFDGQEKRGFCMRTINCFMPRTTRQYVLLYTISTPSEDRAEDFGEQIASPLRKVFCSKVVVFSRRGRFL